MNSRRKGMSSEQKEFLNLRHFPAILDSMQTCWYLGIEKYELSILLAARLLVPLGTPAKNGQKTFAEWELSERRKDVNWLSKCSASITRYPKRKSRKNFVGKKVQLTTAPCDTHEHPQGDVNASPRSEG